MKSVSSSTSSSDLPAFKAYVHGLLAFIVLEAAASLSALYYLDPPSGDVTRLSGLAENTLGWNQAQKTFAEPAKPLVKIYEDYADVLVVGDSFTFAGLLGMMNYPWQTFLTANTGLSVATINYYTSANPPKYDSALLPSIINSKSFQDHPPKILIMEIVERNLKLIPQYPGDCQIKSSLSDFEPPVFKPKAELQANVPIERNKKPLPFKERLGYAFKYLETFFQLKARHNHSYVFNLTTPKLFSSRSSDRLIVVEGDMDKKDWNAQVLDKAACSLANLQDSVQGNGKTLFIAMVVPDKLTAYSPYLLDQTYAKLSHLDRMATVPGLHLLHLEQSLREAIGKGETDVYLPDDTHWSYKGHKIVADQLTRYIGDFSTTFSP